MEIQLAVMPKRIHYQTYSDIRPVFSRFVRSPNVTVSLDLHNIELAKVRTGEHPSITVITDGMMTDDEYKLAATNITTNKTWVWLGTDKQFDTLTSFSLPNDVDIAVSLHYVNDKSVNDKPERYPGQLPAIAYKFPKIPNYKTFELSYSFYMAENMGSN